jgi:hypothetical protein
MVMPGTPSKRLKPVRYRNGRPLGASSGKFLFFKIFYY